MDVASVTKQINKLTINTNKELKLMEIEIKQKRDCLVWRKPNRPVFAHILSQRGPFDLSFLRWNGVP